MLLQLSSLDINCVMILFIHLKLRFVYLLVVYIESCLGQKQKTNNTDFEYNPIIIQIS